MPPLVQNSTARKWDKTTQLGVHDFWRVFPRVFGAQDGVLGARVSFGTQSYVYIGPRVTFR